MENVLKFKTKNPIFNGEIRTNIVSALDGKVENPEQVISTMEGAICNYAMVQVRTAGEELARRLFTWLTSKEESNE